MPENNNIIANTSFADQRFSHPSPGVHAVGQYQMSGIPYATASAYIESDTSGAVTQVSFPYVTKFVTVINEHSGSSSKLKVGFSALGVSSSNDTGKDYFLLDNGESYTGEFRLSSIFLLGYTAATTASVIAGMTGVPSAKLQTNWSGTSGVG